MCLNIQQNIMNPILSGFYPDPSICRVDDDFYMVTSSFSFYPGVPIFHSKNLGQWKQIGHVLDRPEQLSLNPDDLSAGIFAPTIRFHKGLFYMVTTNITTGENFIVTAKDPAGDWSNPHIIEGCGGIDPSLFWDDDGKVYLTRTADFKDPEPPMITMNEIDLNEYKLIGKKKRIWGGAIKGCSSPEAPHLYKKDGYYYLMIAEGGTEHYHAITIARSKQIDGEYEGYAGNPILTHRHLGLDYPISNVGHGDLVELADGSYHMVLLGSRPYGGYHKNMGRETFIVPVIWENGWPVVSPGTGKVEWEYKAPFKDKLRDTGKEDFVFHDDFDTSKLADVWNFIGTPANDIYKIAGSCLWLRAIKDSIGGSDKEKPDFGAIKTESIKTAALAFVGRRQQHMSFTVKTKIQFEPVRNAAAGLIIVQNNYHQLRIELGLNKKGKKVVRAVWGYCTLKPTLEHNWTDEKYKEVLLKECEWESEEAILIIEADMQDYTLSAEMLNGERVILASNINGGFLGSETAGGFIGAYLGMFASGNGEDMSVYAKFDWFELHKRAY